MTEDDTCDMVVERAIEAGEEVFNTYGQLSNAKLLASYGFLLEANEHDIIEFDLDEAVNLYLPYATRREVFIQRFETFQTFDHVSSINDDHPLLHPSDPARISIDADGRLSTGLWLLALAAANDMAGAETHQEVVARLAEAVGLMASEQEVEVEDGAGAATRFIPAAEDVATISLVSQMVLQLCRSYRSRQHKADLGGADLLDLAEVRRPSFRLLLLRSSALRECFTSCRDSAAGSAGRPADLGLFRDSRRSGLCRDASSLASRQRRRTTSAWRASRRTRRAGRG